MLLNEKGDLYDCEALGGVDAPDRPFLCFNHCSESHPDAVIDENVIFSAF